MKLIRPNTAEFLSPSRFVPVNKCRKPSNAHSATRRISTCTTTTENYVRNCAAKSARLFFRPTIVLKERSKPNTFVLTASTRYSAGKPFCTLLFTNAPTTTALIASMPSTDSTPRRNFYRKPNLRNSNFAIFIANIYSRPPISFTLNHSNPPST